jgi:hypothetical protein
MKRAFVAVNWGTRGDVKRTGLSYWHSLDTPGSWHPFLQDNTNSSVSRLYNINNICSCCYELVSVVIYSATMSTLVTIRVVVM